MPETSIGSAAVLGALEQVLASRAFQGAGRSGALLRFLIERTLAGHADQLKEYTVGAEALGRGAAFDPRSDSIVRVEVSRLRSRLDLYYATEGAIDPVWILVPKGSYVPTFTVASPTSSGGSESPTWKLIAAGAIAVAALMAWSPWRERLPEPPVASRFEMDLGDAVTIRSSQVGSSSVVISPDGRRLVFLSFRQQVPRLMTRALDKVEGSQSIELRGTEGARGPFFSWDGRQVGFFAAGKLWRTRVDGGTPVSIAAAEELLGASWGDDDFIVAALSTAGLVRVPAGGGTPEVIPGAPPGARWPQVLPGSRAVLFTAGGTTVAAGALRVDVLSLADGKITTVVSGGSYARYLASGHLAWVRPANASRRAIQPRSAATDRSRRQSHRRHRAEHVQLGRVRCVADRYVRLSLRAGRRRLGRPMAGSVGDCGVFAARASGVFRATAVARRVAHRVRHGPEWRSAGPSHRRFAER